MTSVTISSEERALVGIVVVHGALREAGQRRDLLHRRARIPLAQEQRPRRLDDGRPRPDDARVIRTRARRASCTPRRPAARLTITLMSKVLYRGVYKKPTDDGADSMASNEAAVDRRAADTLVPAPLGSAGGPVLSRRRPDSGPGPGRLRPRAAPAQRAREWTGGWVQTANFVLTGLMVLAAAVGFARVLGPRSAR